MQKILKVEKPALLLEYLFEKLADFPKTRIRKLLKHGCGFIDDEPMTHFDYALQPGDEVFINLLDQPTIIHRNRDK